MRDDTRESIGSVAEPYDPRSYDLVLEHAPLARAIARRYARRGISFEDLEQEGMLGLMDAAQRFDPTLGVRFATYARWWIRSRVQRYVRVNHAIVAMPETRALRRARSALARVTARLEQEQGSAASSDEIARSIGVDEETVALARADRSMRHVSADVAELRAGSYEPDSVEPSPEDEAAQAQIERLAQALVSAALDRLDDRERFIVSERTWSETPRSLADLAPSLSVTAERVRQLEQRAYRKMRTVWAETGRLGLARACAGGLEE